MLADDAGFGVTRRHLEQRERAGTSDEYPRERSSQLLSGNGQLHKCRRSWRTPGARRRLVATILQQIRSLHAVRLHAMVPECKQCRGLWEREKPRGRQWILAQGEEDGSYARFVPGVEGCLCN